jgi:Dullard-like phosphatase family protein
MTLVVAHPDLTFTHHLLILSVSSFLLHYFPFVSNISRLPFSNCAGYREITEKLRDQRTMSARPLAPPIPRPALVLDLDETVVFATAIQQMESAIPVLVGRRRVYVRTRPGLPDFLRAVSQLFDVYFFTAAERQYANQIIDAIAPGTPHSRRFFRENCAYFSGYPVKDLRLVDCPLHRVLIVDDLEGSALLHPQNLLRVSPWYGADEDNVLLSELLPALLECSLHSDLPRALQETLAQKQFSAVYPSSLQADNKD